MERTTGRVGPRTSDCTCKVTGPEYHQTRFDRACPFHGDKGTMVAVVRVQLGTRGAGR